MASLQSLTPSAEVSASFVGKSIRDVVAPAVILDAAIIRRNCTAMIECARRLGVSFRAHVKTHKTRQITALQVGDRGPVKLVVSTVAEIEYLLPQLQHWKRDGREVSVIYGMPIPPSALSRLRQIAALDDGPSIILLLDSPDILQALKGGSHAFDIAVKVDTGYHRSGLAVEAEGPFTNLLKAVRKAETEDQSCRFVGFYSHRGDSYAGSTIEDALEYLLTELKGLEDAASLSKTLIDDRKLLLSFGATPTATVLQSFLSQGSRPGSAIQKTLDALKSAHDLEAHAGVYTTLDLQQVATHAGTASPISATDSAVQSLSTADIAIRVLVEVASVYPHRSPPQALVSAGSLALGREPCKSYPGWAIVTGWRESYVDGELPIVYSEEDRTGWIVSKVSQEHGILEWQGSLDKYEPLQVGQKLLLWPNHACVTGAMFGWYLVVDSGRRDNETIDDVWERGRGW